MNEQNHKREVILKDILENEIAYGCIIINKEGLVYLRKPANNWGGYAWTFSKGSPESGETSEKTALRETKEEMGITGYIICPIPGRFLSDTCYTQYYLMDPVDVDGETDDETSEVILVSYEDAKELIFMTTTEQGRKRDLGALNAAYRVWREK